jgi:hypothetical protein
VINYFFFIAEEVREMLAEMGLHLNRMTLSAKPSCWIRATRLITGKQQGLDFTRLFTKIEIDASGAIAYGSARPSDRRYSRPQAD